MAESNSLGLNFDSLQIKDSEQPSDAQPATPAVTTDQTEGQTASAEQSPTTTTNDAKPEKKKPYINPERVRTGGAQREKLTEEELAERMQRMKEQNEKIKQRRLDVKADEDAFKETQEAERVKQAHTRKMQEGIDRTREQNARRKMDKIQSREWDSGKPAGDWKQTKKAGPGEEGEAASTLPATQQRGGKPGGRGRGGPRGRGRGRGGPPGGAPSPANAATGTTAPEDTPQESVSTSVSTTENVSS